MYERPKDVGEEEEDAVGEESPGGKGCWWKEVPGGEEAEFHPKVAKSSNWTTKIKGTRTVSGDEKMNYDQVVGIQKLGDYD